MESTAKLQELQLIYMVIMVLMNLIENYFIFSRSIRTGDFQAYKFIIPKLTDIFFVFNHPNYSRWLCRYHDNLLNVHKDHPELALEYEKGMFGIKKTNNPFSRIPVDLTLEQTVNADAARSLTGTTNMTNNISARQRWAISSSIRTAIVSHTYDVTGLKKQQDVTSDLEKSKIALANNQVKALANCINQSMNPFRHTDVNHDSLFNIATGKATTKDVSNFLLNVESKGEKLRETFVEDCSKNEYRFEERIKKVDVLNFVSANARKKTVINNKTVELRLQRDLFGRLLFISLTQNTDIIKVLEYPITPVPMSMCQMDGTICKTRKSILFECLKIPEGTMPSGADIIMIDGFDLLHHMYDLPSTFGKISESVLKKVTNTRAKDIHLIFDQYFKPSIKDYERSVRSNNEASRDFAIKGPNQKRTEDFGKSLQNYKFKEALVQFFLWHWSQNEMAPFMQRKIIFFDFHDCYKFEVDENGNVNKSLAHDFSCPAHEEADIKIIYHVCQIEKECNITIKCSDTDILIILLSNMEHLKSTSKIWIESGISGKKMYLCVQSL